ncbi:MAG: DUF4199 domain-containing protein [Bacteroidia bacterium]
MQKSIWIFGVLAGSICAGLEYMFFKSIGGSANIMYISKFAVLLICIVFGLILIRKLLGGTISIARTILSGVLIAAVRAIVMIAAFTFLYYPDGEFYKEKLEISYEQAAKKIESDDEIKDADKTMMLEETKVQIASQYKPTGYMLITIGMSVVSGFIISILMAAFIGTNMMYKE